MAATPAAHCRDFSRSELVRAAAVEAGRGLPAIEPGMPVPAGTGLSRRSFVLRTAGLALAVYGGQALGAGVLEEGVAEAAGPDDPVLVSIFFSGGLDSLSLLAPTGDPRYRALRPTLGLGEGEGTVFSEDSRLRWHPSAAGLSTLHGEGKVSVVPAVGYASPNASHFTSRHFWEVGEVNPGGRVGWLGRYLDRVGTQDNPLQGLALSSTLAPALASATVPVAAVSKPESYTFTAPGVSNVTVNASMLRAWGGLGRLPGGDDALSRARWATAASSTLREQVAPFGSSSSASPVTYPTGGDLPKRLSSLAGMLAGGLPIRCVAVNAAGGYDTHADQARALPANLKLTCDSVLAFQRDLEARGLADRVLIQLWSEFGRRAEENGSGTDHGAAGASLLVGSRVRGEMIGEFPGLDRLENGNLRTTTDFRSLYCSITEQWLGTDAAGIVPGAGSYARPALLRP